jgi:hypothetical protein
MIKIEVHHIEDDEDDSEEWGVTDTGGDWDDEAYQTVTAAEQAAEERLDHYGGEKYAKIEWR